MRNMLLPALCLILCACGNGNTENVGTNLNGCGNSGNQPAANAPDSGLPDHPLIGEIKAMQVDFAQLVADIKGATPEERKGPMREEFKKRGEAFNPRAEEIEKKVLQLNDPDITKAWKDAGTAMAAGGEEAAELLGLKAENERIKATLDIKQLGDLQIALQQMLVDNAMKSKLRSEKVKDTRGRLFYEAALKRRLLEDYMVNKIVSLGSSTDEQADRTRIDEDDWKLDDTECSYTSPIAGELAMTMHKKGDDRTVVVSFNARNWNNYPDRGVLVLWSDGDAPVYMTADEARRDWGITVDEWADPAGKLFGKKAPFQFTYE